MDNRLTEFVYASTKIVCPQGSQGKTHDLTFTQLFQPLSIVISKYIIYDSIAKMVWPREENGQRPSSGEAVDVGSER